VKGADGPGLLAGWLASWRTGRRLGGRSPRRQAAYLLLQELNLLALNARQSSARFKLELRCRSAGLKSGDGDGDGHANLLTPTLSCWLVAW